MAPPAARAPAAPSPADKVAYGGYIVTALAHCFECHTPAGPTGAPDMAKAGAGGFEIELAPGMTVKTANITSDPETGLGSWTDEEIKTAITTGVGKDGTKLAPPMPYGFFKNMTPEQRAAIKAKIEARRAANGGGQGGGQGGGGFRHRRGGGDNAGGDTTTTVDDAQ